ncbi:MAG: response regulator [Myxococcales bacterium]|nr:response regulator [Myxococcales bacterium]
MSAKARVLLIEADKATSQSLQRVLLQAHYEVEIVADGLIALNELDDPSRRPDAILLRVEIPRRNGYSVCNRIKRRDSLRNIPILLYSSQATEESFAQHQRLRTRAQGYLMMPLDYEELLGMMEGLVHGAKVLEEAREQRGTSDTNPNLPSARGVVARESHPDVDRTLVPQGEEEEVLDLDDMDEELLLSSEDITAEKNRQDVQKAIAEQQAKRDVVAQVEASTAVSWMDDELDDADRTIIAKAPVRPVTSPPVSDEHGATDAFQQQRPQQHATSPVQTPLPSSSVPASLGKQWASSSPEVAAAPSTELHAVATARSSMQAPKTGGLAPFPSLTGAPLPPRPQTGEVSALTSRPLTSELAPLPPFPSLVPMSAPNNAAAKGPGGAFSVRNAQAELDALIQSKEPVHISRPEADAEIKRLREENASLRTEQKDRVSALEKARSEQLRAQDELDALRAEQKRLRDEAEALRLQQEQSLEELEALRRANALLQESQEGEGEKALQEEMQAVRKESAWLRKQIIALHQQDEDAFALYPELLAKALAAQQMDGLQGEVEQLRHENKSLRGDLEEAKSAASKSAPQKTKKAGASASLSHQDVDDSPKTVVSQGHDDEDLPTRILHARSFDEDEESPTRILPSVGEDEDDDEGPTRVLMNVADGLDGEEISEESEHLRRLLQEAQAQQEASLEEMNDLYARITELERERQRLQSDVDAQAEKAAQHARAHSDALSKRGDEVEALEEQLSALAIEVDEARKQVIFYQGLYNEREALVEAQRNELIETQAALEEQIQAACDLRGEVAGFRSQLNGQSLSEDELLSQLSEREKELQQLREEVNRLGDDHDELAERYREIEAELDALKQTAREDEHALHSLRIDKERLEKQLHQHADERERLKESQAEVRRALVEEHEAAAQVLRDELARVRAELDTARENGEKEFERAEGAKGSRIEALEREKKSLQAEKKALEEQLEKELSGVSDAQEAAHRAKAAQQQLQDDLDRLQEDLDASRAEARNRLEVEELLRKQLAELQDRRVHLEEELERAQGKLQNVGDSTEQMEQELVLLRQQNTQIEQEKFDWQERAERFESELRNLRELLQAEQSNRVSDVERQERLLDQLHRAEKGFEEWKTRAQDLEEQLAQETRTLEEQAQELSELRAEQSRLDQALAMMQTQTAESQKIYQESLDAEQRQAQQVMQSLERDHEESMERVHAQHQAALDEMRVEHQEVLQRLQQQTQQQLQELERQIAQQERGFESHIAREREMAQREYAEKTAGLRQEHALEIERLLAEHEKEQRQTRTSQQESLAEQEISFHAEKREMREAFQREMDALHGAQQQEMEAFQLQLQEQSHQVLSQMEKEQRQLRKELRMQKEETLRERQERENELQAEMDKRADEVERRTRLRYEAIIEGLEQRERDLAAQCKIAEDALSSAKEAEQSAILGNSVIQNELEDLRGRLSDIEALRRLERNQIDLLKREYDQKLRAIEHERDELRDRMTKTSDQSEKLHQQVKMEKAKKDQALDALQNALSMLREHKDG